MCHVNNWAWFNIFSVEGLAKQWKQGIPGKTVEVKVFNLPQDHSQLQSFIDKYKKNQQQLQTQQLMISYQVHKVYIIVDVMLDTAKKKS